MPANNTLDVVCALIFFDGKVLASRRDSRRSFPLMWEFPGGKLEPGESAEDALHRELEEELRLTVADPVPLDPVLYAADGQDIRLLPFLCRPSGPWSPVPLDHCEIRWITTDVALQLTWAPADIPLVRQLPDLLARAG